MIFAANHGGTLVSRKDINHCLKSHWSGFDERPVAIDWVFAGGIDDPWVEM
jgi:hypothetical protein